MDCLIPFVETYSASKGDIVLSAAVAWKAMLATEALKPKLGRAAYASEGKALPGSFSLSFGWI